MSCSATPDTLTKQPYEYRQYSMDFSALMTTGETISTYTVTSELIGGGTTDLVIDTIASSGQIITFWIDGGTQRNRYKIECRVVTSIGQKLEADGILRVID
jgi:hypothetical protein